MSPAATRSVIACCIAVIALLWGYDVVALFRVYRRPWASPVLRAQRISWLWPTVALGPLVMAFLLIALWATK